MKISGIILAGGQSERMGRDKALLEVNGTRMIQKSIDALKPICAEILIISNNDELSDLGFPVFKDIHKNIGPLGGIHSGLFNASNEICIVLSCDVPNIETAILARLVNAMEFCNAAVSQCKDRLHPLVAVYRKSSWYDIDIMIKEGKTKLIDCAEILKAEKIQFDDEQESCFFNMNSPKDLDSWEEK